MLNTQQFSVDEIGNWASGNMPGYTVAQEYDARFTGANPAEDEHAQYYGYRNARDYQGHLNMHVAEHGIRTPLTYSPPGTPDLATGEPLETHALENGYHRYAAARDLGIKHLNAQELGPYTGPRPNKKVPGWKGGR